jgi:hypothetical protein
MKLVAWLGSGKETSEGPRVLGKDLFVWLTWTEAIKAFSQRGSRLITQATTGSELPVLGLMGPCLHVYKKWYNTIFSPEDPPSS